MKKILKIFKSDSKDSREKTTREVINGAYKERTKEIESLRKYDRGEKTITPIDLKTIVRGV